MFDDNQPRNAVTQESHGFLTRDGVKPDEFRTLAHQDISKYPSVEIQHVRVTAIRHADASFEITTEKGDLLSAKTVLLATGLKELLPTIDGLHDYYGKSVFCCPYCDGWELRERPLVVISEGPHTFNLVKVVWNWSHDLLLCTNGHQLLTREQQETLRQKGIQVVEDRITALPRKKRKAVKAVLSPPSCSRLRLLVKYSAVR